MILFSFDDYSEHNLRIAGMMNKYEMPAIFFINFGDKMAGAQIKKISDMGFQIGGHTMTHPQDLKILTEYKMKKEIKKCRRKIMEITGRKIDWFAYPRGRYDDRVKYIVRGAGYRFARTTRVFNDNLTDDFALPTSVHLFPRAEYEGRDPFDLAKLFFYNCKTYCHIWAHGKEIEELRYWEKLENLLKEFNEYIFREQ